MPGEVQFKPSLAAIPSMQFTQKKVLKSSDPFLSSVSHLGESWLCWNSNQFTQSMWQWLVTYLPLFSHPLNFSWNFFLLSTYLSQMCFSSVQYLPQLARPRYQTQFPSLITPSLSSRVKIWSNSAKTTAFDPSQRFQQIIQKWVHSNFIFSWVASGPYKQKVMIYSSPQFSLRMAVDHAFLISN